MIKINYTEVFGWQAAIRGMRNPMNSWHLSDTNLPTIGPKDLDLMKRLIKAGPDHSKFMRFIIVTCDITAPFYWWKEYDTYKVGTVANSASTMHKIHSKPLTTDDFSAEHLDMVSSGVLKAVIDSINESRVAFRESDDKKFWWQMIQLLPTSYNQKRTVLLNYAVLRNMYHARKNHKLDEWRAFCKWVESLPYSELVTDLATPS